jgi:polar amino acid transport system substrate-binding protein
MKKFNIQCSRWQLVLFQTVLAVLLFISCITAILAEDITVEVWVDESYPPFTYIKNKEVKGIYVEVLKRISQRMQGYKIKFVAAPWQRVKQEVKTGRAFAFAPPFYHGQDWVYVWPYSLPIMDEVVGLICRADILMNKRPNWPDDYQGLVIANNVGFDGFGGAKFREFVAEGKITLQETQTAPQNILMMLKGRSDCYMANLLSYEWEMNKLMESGQVSTVDKAKLKKALTISIDAVYIGFTDMDQGKFSFKKDFHQKINNELYNMYKSNEIKQIADEYIRLGQF